MHSGIWTKRQASSEWMSAYWVPECQVGTLGLVSRRDSANKDVQHLRVVLVDLAHGGDRTLTDFLGVGTHTRPHGLLGLPEPVVVGEGRKPEVAPRVCKREDVLLRVDVGDQTDGNQWSDMCLGVGLINGSTEQARCLCQVLFRLAGSNGICRRRSTCQAF